MTVFRQEPLSHWIWMLLPALIAAWLLTELLLLVAQQPLDGVTVLHASTALTSVMLGTLTLASRKGSLLHRTTGYCWVVLMITVSISSFWLRTLPWFPGGFGPIHILSITTLIALFIGVMAARKHNIKRHRASMLFLIWGLLGAGIFTLLPHRLMGFIAWGS